MLPLLSSTAHFIGNTLDKIGPEVNVEVSNRIEKEQTIENYSQTAKYLNVGGGTFVREDWRVLDYYSEWYDYDEIFIDYDVNLERCNRWPIENNLFDLIFSSHTLEHLSDEAVKDVLSEMKRTLRPGGRIRLNVPDVDIAEEKYNNGDPTWFIKRRGGESKKQNTPEFHIEEQFIGFFATHLINIDKQGHEKQTQRIDFENVRKDYDSMNNYDFYQKYTNLIEDSWQQKNQDITETGSIMTDCINCCLRLDSKIYPEKDASKALK